MSNLTQRILTALVGAPILAGAAYLGDWYFAGVVAALAVASQHEVYGLHRAAGIRPLHVSGLMVGAVLALRGVWVPALPLALGGAVLLTARSTFAEREQPLLAFSSTLAGLVYPVAFLSFLTDIRQARGPQVDDLGGFLLVVTLFLLIWATDIMAYVTGRTLGKHPLAPSISPKKTWEGAVGGAVGAVLVAVGLRLTLVPFLSWIDVIALALICGVFSQVGDLAESRMKRAVNIKDSGRWLPGHGGFLDRFDAMILAAPAFYLYLRFGTALYG